MIVLINVAAILMMSAKLATLGLFKIKILQNKLWYHNSVHDTTNKLLLRDSNYIADLVMWHYHFYEWSIKASILYGSDKKKKQFSWGVLFVQVQ